MPRYATGSLERAIYSNIKREARLNKKHVFVEKATKERTNSVRSRAHRHQQFMAPDPVTCVERLNAIRGVMRLVGEGWTTPENAVSIIHNITKGE